MVNYRGVPTVSIVGNVLFPSDTELMVDFSYVYLIT